MWKFKIKTFEDLGFYVRVLKNRVTLQCVIACTEFSVLVANQHLQF